MPSTQGQLLPQACSVSKYLAACKKLDKFCALYGHLLLPIFGEFCRVGKCERKRRWLERGTGFFTLSSLGTQINIISHTEFPHKCLYMSSNNYIWGTQQWRLLIVQRAGNQAYIEALPEFVFGLLVSLVSTIQAHSKRVTEKVDVQIAPQLIVIRCFLKRQPIHGP